MAADPALQKTTWLLEQLADLIARQGSAQFIAAPIVEPTPQFFPDPWTPDSEGARFIALRLLRYAGLPELDVHLEDFTNEWWSPTNLLGFSGFPHQGQAAALFAGIQDGVCYFGVDEQHLDEPDMLVGALGHEVAHAWRRSKQLEVEDGRDEEWLTDLTAAYLGFGVLSLNAAYQFKATARYTQQGLGYIGVDGFCFLLAIQCLARGEDRQRIRKLLNSPVAGIFEVAWDTLERDRILEALALPPPEQRPEPLTETPDLLPVTLSPVQRRVLALAEREASRADPDSGLFDLPVPCDFSVGQARQLGLVAWGYFGPGPHRWGGLHLVEVPGLAKHLLVVESGGAGDVETRALGLIDDAVASRREDLVMALEPIFAANGLPGVPFFTELPAYVQWTTKAWVRLGDLKELVLLAVRHLDLDRLEECVERLDRYFDDIWEREPISRQPLPCPRASEAATNLSRQTEKLLNEWWDLARNPDLADEKAARLESRSGSRQT